MALLSNIIIDLVAKTANLSCSVSGNTVENITYDNTTNQITFASRADIIINFSDFLPFCDQINIFESAILFNYPSIDVFSVFPFSQIITTELHNAGIWNLTVTPLTHPNIVQYQATKSTTQVEMIPRLNSQTLSFPEWLYFLQILNHYRISIKGF